VRYRISHLTTYNYSQPVALLPHIVRLRPRASGDQALEFFQLQVEPTPLGMTQLLDAEGNSVLRLWWGDQPTTTLQLQSDFQVITYCTNPFHYLLEPWAARLPIDYPSSLLGHLQPYLAGHSVMGIAVDPIAVQLGQELAQAVDHNPVMFLSELTQRIYRHCQTTVRDQGLPLPPSVTWNQQLGSCRDLAVLFMAACRSVGLACRFVSGYQEGDPDSTDGANYTERHLHAWVEVYLPGGGWRGYDPTQGLAVSDRHIPLVASAWSEQAAPVTGFRGGGARSVIKYLITLQTLTEPGLI
jgi:transglutaminase-like putative cysteine protease